MRYKKNADGTLAVDEKGNPIVLEAETKEMTMDELKAVVGEAITGAIAPIKADVDEIKTKGLPAPIAEKPSALEVAAKFIRDLIDNKSELKAVSSSTASLGYTVPTELATAILEKRDKIAKVRKYAFVFNLAGTYQLPVEGTAVTAYWVGENTEVTESDPTVGKKTLDDYYLAARVLIPRKLVNTSAANIVAFISNLCARAIRNTEETAFIAGDGSSKPTGLRQASITSYSQAGATLAYDDIVNLFYGLPEQYRTEAVFITSAAGIKAIRKIKDSQGIPIFDVNTQTLFGRPLLESEDIPSNLGSGGDTTELYFGDLWYYWVKDGESLFADTDKIISKLQVEIVLAEAVDGVLTLTDAFRKLTGVK